MSICLICNKEFGMITESHLRTHDTTCKEYAQKFQLSKGQVNPRHSARMKAFGNPRYGAVVLNETKEKIRSRHMQSGKFRGKNNPMSGKTHSLEFRQKLSELYKKNLVGKGNPFYGKKHTPETRLRISQIRIQKGVAKGEKNPLFGKGHTDKTKQYISQLKKEFFRKNPEKHINSIIARNYRQQKNKRGGYISKKQIELYKILQKKYPDASLNLPIKTETCLYFADIAILSLGIDLEYDSTYWHKNALKDIQRDKNIQASGWQVIRVKDKHIIHLDNAELSRYICHLIEKTVGNQK